MTIAWPEECDRRKLVAGFWMKLAEQTLEERDEARKLAEDEMELRQEAVEAAREMGRQIDRHDSKLAEIERERDEARKLAEEYRNALIEVRDGVSIPSDVIGSLPWEEQ